MKKLGLVFMLLVCIVLVGAGCKKAVEPVPVPVVGSEVPAPVVK